MDGMFEGGAGSLQICEDLAASVLLFSEATTESEFGVASPPGLSFSNPCK